jgi:hypothetical protein
MIVVTISDEMSVNMLVAPSRSTVRLTRAVLLLPVRARVPRTRTLESATWYTTAPAGEQPLYAKT